MTRRARPPVLVLIVSVALPLGAARAQTAAPVDDESEPVQPAAPASDPDDGPLDNDGVVDDDAVVDDDPPPSLPPAPPAEAPAEAAAVDILGPTVAAAPTGQAPWWSTLEDEALAQLIDDALVGNIDLMSADARARQLEAASFGALAPMLPQASFDVSSNVSPFESLGFQFGGLGGGGAPSGQAIPVQGQVGGLAKEAPPIVYYTGSALVRGSLRADPGRTWMSHRAGVHDAEASRHDRDAQAASLAFSIARTYYDLAAAKAQVQVIERQQKATREILQLTELRFSAGEASALDVLQQRQQVASAEAQLPTARAQVRLLEQQISVLLGRSPTEPLGVDVAALPSPAAVPEVDDTGALTDERPDVRAAHARVESAEARKASALLGFLPTLSLNAQAGSQYILLNEPDAQLVWGLGATLSIPIFQGGQNIANWRQAAHAEEAASQTERAIRLRARQAIEGALARERELHLQLAAQRNELAAARAAFDSSRERYVAGLSNYQAVLTALSATYRAELTIISVQRQLLDARLSLLDAVAGPWTADLAPGGAP